MAARKLSIAAGILLSALATSALAGNSEVAEADVLDAANKNFLRAVADLSTTIDSCGKAAEKRAAPLLNKSKLEKLKAKREDLLIGLSHLSFHNMFQCEREARLTAAYAAGTLMRVMQETSTNSKDVQDVQQAMIFAPTEHIRYQLRYFQMSPDLHQYLEKRVGDRPFEIIETLEANGLMQE